MFFVVVFVVVVVVVIMDLTQSVKIILNFKTVQLFSTNCLVIQTRPANSWLFQEVIGCLHTKILNLGKGSRNIVISYAILNHSQKRTRINIIKIVI